MPNMLEKVRVGGKVVASPRGLVPTGASDVVYQEFLVTLRLYADDPIGRVVRLALASSPDPRFHAFIELALSESGKQMHLATMAKMCQISLIEFQAFWRDARVNQAITAAIENLPVLTKDMIDDAKSDETTCPMCDGTGQVQREGKPDKLCPNCSGKGVLRTIGDKHARNKLLEMTGVIKKEAPVQVNLNMHGLGMNSAAAKLQQAVPFDLDDVTDVEATTIDSTPVSE